MNEEAPHISTIHSQPENKSSPLTKQHIQKLTIFVLSNNRIQLVIYYGKSRNKGRPLYVYYLKTNGSTNKKETMETTKEIYEAPLCTIIEVDAQEVICTSGTHQGFEEDKYPYGW